MFSYISSSYLCACVFLFFFPSEHDLGEDDIYDCVPCEDDGDDIYEDIIKVEVRQPMVRAVASSLFSDDINIHPKAAICKNSG